MAPGIFLDRMWSMFWVVALLGLTLLCWISTVRCSLTRGVGETLLNLALASLLTTILLAADALKILGR